MSSYLRDVLSIAFLYFIICVLNSIIRNNKATFIINCQCEFKYVVRNFYEKFLYYIYIWLTSLIFRVPRQLLLRGTIKGGPTVLRAPIWATEAFRIYVQRDNSMILNPQLICNEFSALPTEPPIPIAMESFYSPKQRPCHHIA